MTITYTLCRSDSLTVLPASLIMNGGRRFTGIVSMYSALLILRRKVSVVMGQSYKTIAFTIGISVSLPRSSANKQTNSKINRIILLLPKGFYSPGINWSKHCCTERSVVNCICIFFFLISCCIRFEQGVDKLLLPS